MDHAALIPTPEVAGAVPVADKCAGRLAGLVPVAGRD